MAAKWIRRGLAAAAAVVLLQACAEVSGGAGSPAAARPALLTLTDQDNGRRLPLRVGDRFELRLVENASTGFQWEPDGYDAVLLELTERTSSYPNPEGLAGAPGEAIFRFRVAAPGSGALALKYRRPWEDAGSAARRFAVTIVATP